MTRAELKYRRETLKRAKGALVIYRNAWVAITKAGELSTQNKMILRAKEEIADRILMKEQFIQTAFKKEI